MAPLAAIHPPAIHTGLIWDQYLEPYNMSAADRSTTLLINVGLRGP